MLSEPSNDMTRKKIDSHHHFWCIDRGDYGWLTPDMSVLYRDYLPGDFAPLLPDANVVGSILVQAAPTEAETRYLLDLASRTPFVLGVVGWIDFDADDAAERVGHAAAQDRLVGVRPMIQDMQEAEWVLRPGLAPAFEALLKSDLTFDALIRSDQIGIINQLALRYPALRIIVDHCAKPRIAIGEYDTWSENIQRIAKQNNVFCKFSGLTTEAGQDWHPDHLAPYFDRVWESFGPDRLLWGSDWPVCLDTASYASWCRACDSLTTGLTADEQGAFVYNNALRAYNLHIA